MSVQEETENGFELMSISPQNSHYKKQHAGLSDTQGNTGYDAEERRNKRFRKVDSNRSIPSRYLNMTNSSQLQREEYWEKKILDEFELEDEDHRHGEDIREIIGDILAQEPEKLRDVIAPLQYRKSFKSKITSTLGVLRKDHDNEEKTLIEQFNQNFVSYKQKVTELREYQRGHENLRGLWSSDIKKIEGKYGSGVGTYFRFLRSLLGLNIFISILSLCFVYVPQIIFRHKDYNTTNGFYPQDFSVEDIFTGEGWLADTELYYGAYTNETFQNVSLLTIQMSYNIPTAYIYTSLFCYVFTLILIAFWMAQSYKNNFIVGAQDIYQKAFCERSFASWDFSVTGIKSLKNRFEANSSQLKELSETTELRKKKEARKRMSKADLLSWIQTILCWGFILGLIALISWATIETLDGIYQREIELDDLNFGKLIAVSLLISVILWIFPMIFTLFSRYLEEYSVRDRNYTDLSRTIILALVLLGAVVIKHIQQANDKEDTDGNNDNNVMGNNNTMNICWENQVGEQMYQLVLLYFFILVILPLLFETVLGFLYRRFSGLKTYGLQAPEFDIGRNTVYLIYAQTVTWIGFFFSPLLPLVFVIVLPLTFYVKRLSLLNFSASSKPWAASQMQSVFYLITFLSYLLAFGIALSCITGIFFDSTPSESCGPFRGYENPYDFISSEGNAQDFILLKPAVPVAGYVFLLIALYVSTSYTYTRKKEVKGIQRAAKITAKENILLGIANNRAAKEIMYSFEEKREEKIKRRKSGKKKNRTSTRHE